jgi:hypothetical protein
MTLEMPEIDSKGQSAHLCFYLLNALNFPVLLFYSVESCPPQRTYVYFLLAGKMAAEMREATCAGGIFIKGSNFGGTSA